MSIFVLYKRQGVPPAFYVYNSDIDLIQTARKLREVNRTIDTVPLLDKHDCAHYLYKDYDYYYLVEHISEAELVNSIALRNNNHELHHVALCVFSLIRLEE